MTQNNEYDIPIEAEPGSMVEGDVVEILKDTVLVNIGMKSEGKVQISEFNIQPNIGDVFKFVITKSEDTDGLVQLSKLEADKILALKRIRTAINENRSVNGEIVEKVKAGYLVDLGGKTYGFMPMSHTSLKRKDPSELIGKIEEFKVLEYKPESNTIKLSHRLIEKEKKDRERSLFYEKYKEGDVIRGRVKNFSNFGAFIDIGGLDGLLHVNNISWAKVSSPEDYLKLDQEIDIKILSIEKDKDRVSLGLKQMTDDPWLTIEKKYKPGDIVTGTVKRIKNFGAFIEIEAGVEGLVRTEELSWLKDVTHPKQVLTINDKVKMNILSIDKENRKIALSLRQILENPWDDMPEKFPIGSVVNGTVVKFIGPNAIISLGNGVEGFLHKSNLSWVKKGITAQDILKKRQSIKVKILNINKEEQKIDLGIKQIKENPWEKILIDYKPGTLIQGKVVSIKKFGIFVEIDKNLEGMVPLSHISKDKIDNPNEVVKTGDIVQAAVIRVNPDEQKITLSIRDYDKYLEKTEIEEYISKEEESISGGKLGEILKIKLSN